MTTQNTIIEQQEQQEQQELLRLLKHNENDFDNIYNDIKNAQYDENGMPYANDAKVRLINQICAKYNWTYSEYQRAYHSKQNSDAEQQFNRLLRMMKDGKLAPDRVTNSIK